MLSLLGLLLYWCRVTVHLSTPILQENIVQVYESSVLIYSFISSCLRRDTVHIDPVDEGC